MVDFISFIKSSAVRSYSEAVHYILRALKDQLLSAVGRILSGRLEKSDLLICSLSTMAPDCCTSLNR